MLVLEPVVVDAVWQSFVASSTFPEGGSFRDQEAIVATFGEAS